ncbi:hypothetical protein C0992_012572 [Termitomyces sp. T32_za158]|nr:hypothetical protein C0992_012572 [Termitomyces sp. T32_za158]
MAANQTLPSFAQAFSSVPSPKHRQDNDDPAPPSKRRRVTISGAPHALITDVPAATDHASSTPISPVVMGLTLTPDNPLAIEKVKSMLSVKQKQKALIDQRRGSAAGTLSPTVPPARPSRPSPRTAPSRPSSPPPPPPPLPTHALPPPPISFARRRAEQLGSARKKPADILISPRDPANQPAIQSAPPLAHGRFPTMALPRLPNVLRAADPRRVATAVPPTPTRLALHRPAARRSPPTASVPIASTLVPTTPAHPSDKAAFLAPFELFYDALNDSRQLKAWLAEQLQRSHALVQQQELVVAPLRQEIGALQRRVDDLEDALRVKHKPSRASLRNGLSGSPMPVEFPPSAGLEPSLSSRRRVVDDAEQRRRVVADADRRVVDDAEQRRPDAEHAEPTPPPPPRRMDTTRSLPLEPPPLPPPPRLSPRVPLDTASPRAPADRPALSRTHSSAGERKSASEG